MKPLLDDFNPEMTCIYDESLKGIVHDQYLERMAEVKVQYGRPLISDFSLLMFRYRDA
jgi:hypothetical protein